MRKRNVSFIADKLLWFIILILPLLFAMVFTCASMNNYQLELEGSNLIIDRLDVKVFNSNLMFYDDNQPVKIFYLGFNNLVDFDLAFDDDDGEVITYATRYSITQYIFVDLVLYEDYTVSPSDFYFRMIITDSLGSDYSWQFSDNFIYYSDNVDGYYVSVDLSSCIYNVNYEGRNYNLLNYDSGYYYGCLFNGLVTSDNIFKTYFNNLNYSLDSWFTFGDRDIVYNAFNSIFGSQSNILPIFIEGSFIPKYLTYMSWIYVLHIAFDFLVFIPRLVHKWMGGVYHDDE